MGCPMVFLWFYDVRFITRLFDSIFSSRICRTVCPSPPAIWPEKRVPQTNATVPNQRISWGYKDYKGDVVWRVYIYNTVYKIQYKVICIYVYMYIYNVYIYNIFIYIYIRIYIIILLNLNHRNSYDKSRFIWYSSLDEEFLGCRKKGVQSRSRALDLLAGTFSHLGLVEWQLGLPYESHDILRVKTYIALLRVKRYIAYGSYDVLSFLRPRC